MNPQIRVSEQVRLAADRVEEPEEPKEMEAAHCYDKLTTSKIAKALGFRTGELNDRLLAKTLLERDGDELRLTEAGKLPWPHEKREVRRNPFSPASCWIRITTTVRTMSK